MAHKALKAHTFPEAYGAYSATEGTKISSEQTFTELIRGACHWYLESPQANIAEKKSTSARAHSWLELEHEFLV
jgi:hypothetical protein